MKTWFGTMALTKDNMTMAIRAAMDDGYFGIDSAWIYNNEDVVGKSLKELEEQGYRVRVQTKIWTDHFKDVKNVFEDMLKRLQQDAVYSLLLHRPSLDFKDSITAWKALIELKASGKVEHIGVSNFDKDMIRILINETGVKPEFNQIEMSVSNFRHDRLFYNFQEGIEVQAWSPMGKDVVKNLSNQVVKDLAIKYGVEPSQILLSFLASQKIVPVSSSSKPDHIRLNIDYVSLGLDEIKKLFELNGYDNKFTETYP